MSKPDLYSRSFNATSIRNRRLLFTPAGSVYTPPNPQHGFLCFFLICHILPWSLCVCVWVGVCVCVCVCVCACLCSLHHCLCSFSYFPSLSHVQLFEIPFQTLLESRKASLFFTLSLSLLKLMSTESVMTSNHLNLSPFSTWPQSFPASGSFPTSWLFASGSQNTEASALVLSVNIQHWFPLGLTSLVSLLSKELS